MTTQFKAKPPSPVKWSSIPKHFMQRLHSLAYILWQIAWPFNARPEEIAEFPEADPEIEVTESHVKECQWIFDQAEGRRSDLEQKAQSTFSLMLFLVPLLASLLAFIVGKGTTSKAFAFTLTVTIISSIFLLLAFIAAVRAIAVKGGETLFLDAVVHESGQFRKYSEAFHARGLLYCASMNTAMNDHIAQFVKGAHILSAAAVLTLLAAAIPSTITLATGTSPPFQAKIVGPVEFSAPELNQFRTDIATLKAEVGKLSKTAKTEEDIELIERRIEGLNTQIKRIQATRTTKPAKTN